MRILLGVCFLLLPSIILFGIAWREEGFKVTALIFGGATVAIGIIISCATLAAYLLEGVLK